MSIYIIYGQCQYVVVPGSKRDTYHHGDLRQGIIQSALEILDADGVDAVSIRAVARRAGVSHSAPANHFRDRRALLTALAVHLFHALNDAVESDLASAPSNLRGHVQCFARTLIDFGLSRPNRYRMLWRRDLLDDTSGELQTEMDTLYDRLADEIHRVAVGKRFDRDTYAVALWSMVHGYVSLRLDGNLESRIDPRSGTKREDAIVDAFLDAFAT